MGEQLLLNIRFHFGVMINFQSQMEEISEQLCEYTENHWTVQLKGVYFMVCELYLNKNVIF